MANPEFTCSVVVQYLQEHSEPDKGHHAFSYTVTIANTGDITAQLIARHWTIVDGNGQSHEVRGLAVVGHQPVLKPGEKFEYTSWTPLETPQGTMRGTFFCITEDAVPFEAAVPEFLLSRPHLLH
jgi:ApaG protein